MNINHLKLCAWAGPVFIVVIMIGYLLTGMLPPIDPMASAEEVAAVYTDNLVGIRTGLLIMIFGAAFFAPYAAAIAVLMTRMGNPSPALILTFVMACGGVFIGLFVILVGWGAAAYRPDEYPEITRAFNDFTFIFLLWPGTVMPVIYTTLGLSILADTRRPRVFPRWFGFFSFWMALAALTGTLIIFFKHGPFAVNGVFAFWINLGTFFMWFVINIIVLIQSANRELALEAAGGDPAGQVTA